MDQWSKGGQVRLHPHMIRPCGIHVGSHDKEVDRCLRDCRRTVGTFLSTWNLGLEAVQWVLLHGWLMVMAGLSRQGGSYIPLRLCLTRAQEGLAPYHHKRHLLTAVEKMASIRGWK